VHRQFQDDRCEFFVVPNVKYFKSTNPLKYKLRTHARSLVNWERARQFHRRGDGADVVIGPVEDGGYVLIGLARPQPRLFADMPWSTSTVRDATLRRAAELGLHVVVLKELWDVDDEPGYRRWQRLAATADRRLSKSSE